MEMSSQQNKERLLRMILKPKKKRKPAKVVPSMNVDGQLSSLFPDNTSLLDYRAESEPVRENLKNIIENR